MTERTPTLPGLVTPAQQLGDRAFNKQMQQLTDSVRKAHPDIAPPEIIILKPRLDKEWQDLVTLFERMSVRESISLLASIPSEKRQYAIDAYRYSAAQYSAASVKSYFPAESDQPRNIVYMGETLFNALNNQERRAIFAHEWGHYFIDVIEGGIPNPTAEQRRISECKSDHWARFYADPAALVSGMMKATRLLREQSADEVILTENNPDSTHPTLKNRYKILLSPTPHHHATEAPFDGQCNLPSQPSKTPQR